MKLYEINPFLRYAQQFRHHPQGITVVPMDARIFYIVSGSGMIDVDGSTYSLSRGTMVLINAGFPYCLSGEDLDMIALNFDFTYDRKDIVMFLGLGDPDALPSVKKTVIEDCPVLSSPLVLQGMTHVESDLREIISVFQSQRIYCREHAVCLLKAFLIQLARSTLQSTVKASAISNQLIAYLQEHYQEDLTCDDIALHFNYHTYHINRIMRNATGTTVHKYLINYRISMSKSLLCNTNMTIEDIAAEVGFKNTPYYSNTFKKIVGCSPSYYRNRHIKICK